MENINVNLSDMRVPYFDSENCIFEDKLSSFNPFVLFDNWFKTAQNKISNIEVNAVCLSTCSLDLKPSSRMVLLKGFSESDGFKFFTNFESRKAKEIFDNPNASLLFYWNELKLQIRIEGKVNKISDEESTDYFISRPIDSQISAICSEQSKPIESRLKLENKFKDIKTEFTQNNQLKFKKPNYWGGFTLVPERFEFWKGQTNRLHDRIVFFKKSCNPTKNEQVFAKVVYKDWQMMRLQP